MSATNAGSPHLTAAQIEAVRETNRSLLVSAAAGSGKTTVLAERCLALVCDVEESRRCDIDDLLVVTFTDAAAGEMRDRIRSALRRRLDEQPGDEHLQRQVYLLECANISTIHSFCKTLIERYFPQAEVDPQAAVLSEDEADLLRHEVLDELFMTLYASSEPEALAFQCLVDDYGAGADEIVRQAVLQVHGFLATLPDPDRWLDESLRHIRPDDPGSLLNTLHACQRDRLGRELQAQMEYCRHLSDAIRTAWPAAAMHADSIDEYRLILRDWFDRLASGPPDYWETLAAQIREFPLEWGTRRPGKLSDEAKAAFDAAKAQRDKCKDYFDRRLRQRLCAFTASEYRDGLARIAPHVRCLVGLVRQFDQLYSQAKTAQAVVDFGDLQRKACRLLADADDPSRPSDVARQLQRRYRYMLVDEFQDVDPLQESILRLVSRESADPPEGNLFTVGDIKQSIYRFRLAEPGLFTKRADRFSETQSLGRVIPLQENFRSRPGVVDAINLIFEPLMSRDFGGSDYDQFARLHAGAIYPAGGEAPSFDRPAVELHVLEPITEQTRSAPNESDESDTEPANAALPAEELEGIQREAYLIGRRIREWMGLAGGANVQMQVAAKPPSPGGTPAMRPIEYRDMVILLRSLWHKAEPIADVLRRMGLPVRIERQATAMDTTEFRDCLSLLQILDNFQQDIPLAAVLRSPLLGAAFNESELLAMRMIDRGIPFHAAVRRYAISGRDRTLRERLVVFLSALDGYRARIRRAPVADVLWEIYEDSNYLAYVCGLPDGGRRREHLVRIHELARQFGRFSRQGLRRFLHFMDDFLKRERQPVQAGAGGDENCIRIMTIHASKGLEFPVVVLADLHKKFNLDELRGPVLLDRRHGIAMQASDPERRILYPTLPHQLAVEETLHQSLSEELRVLYVALTRAREHLLLVGRMSPQRVTLYRTMRATGRRLPRLQIESAVCMLDWLLSAVGGWPEGRVHWRDDAAGPVGALFEVTTYSRSATDRWRMPPAVDPGRAESLAAVARLEPLPVDEPVADREQAEQLVAALCEDYPARSLTAIPGRLSVGELKRRWETMTDGDRPRTPQRPNEMVRPAFTTEGAARDPVVRGSATHRFLQLVDLARPCDLPDLRAQLDSLRDAGRITLADADAVLIESAAWFFGTPLGQEVRAAHAGVHREVAFDTRISPRRIDPHAADLDTRDVILVRGMVDLLFDTPAGLKIVDYKTDALAPEACRERAEAYRAQLDTYATAMQDAYARPLAHRLLVFLCARVIIEM